MYRIRDDLHDYPRKLYDYTGKKKPLRESPGPSSLFYGGKLLYPVRPGRIVCEYEHKKHQGHQHKVRKVETYAQ